MRGASFEQRAKVAVQKDDLRERPEQTERGAIANQVGHDRHAILAGELMAVPERLKWPSDLLILKRARRIEMRDLRHEPYLRAEVRRLPGHDGTGSEQVGRDARDNALAFFSHRREMDRHAAREIEALLGRSTDRRRDPEGAQG